MSHLTPLNLPALFSIQFLHHSGLFSFFFSCALSVSTLSTSQTLQLPFQMSEMPPPQHLPLLRHQLHRLRLSPGPHLHPHLSTHPASRSAHTHFVDLGLWTHIVDYRALLSYPLHSSLSAHFSDRSSRSCRWWSRVGPGGGGAISNMPTCRRGGTGRGSVCELGGGGLLCPKEGRVDVMGCVAVVRRRRSQGRVVGRAAEEGRWRY
ncbi:hypothetical protein AAG906_001785 [Vitis piasezkii]